MRNTTRTGTLYVSPSASRDLTRRRLSALATAVWVVVALAVIALLLFPQQVSELLGLAAAVGVRRLGQWDVPRDDDGPQGTGRPWAGVRFSDDPRARDGHAELDRLTARAAELADDYARKATALADDPWPPVDVVPVQGGFRVHSPGRVPGSTAQSAVVFPDRRSAEAAADAVRAGLTAEQVLAESQRVASRVAGYGERAS